MGIKMGILDLSKALISKFYYDYVKEKLYNNSRLVFTDTDNLMHEIKTKDVYQDLIKNNGMFDFNNYSAKSKDHDIHTNYWLIK